ncbi:hypothetical protein [Bifidobacterium breve]|uniref:hypothetical protein n=1 Tax=Bifidobacterium breve TaxID=1685 RepID=UPI000CA0A63B|nr:hypothetical protein [Bifidobacterium breve]AUD87076.1 hypothetical protein NRBB57_1070 [Bifidobacterium breve]
MEEERIAVVFDCNIYITCAELTGVPFSFRRLMNRKPADSEDRVRQLALLSGYAGGVTAAKYSIFWSGHIIDEVQKHLRNDSFWSIGEAQEYTDTIQTQLIDYSGGRTLDGFGEGWGELPDHEDRMVYETALQLAVDDPALFVLLVSADREFIRMARDRCNRGNGSERRVMPIDVPRFLRIGG